MTVNWRFQDIFALYGSFILNEPLPNNPNELTSESREDTDQTESSVQSEHIIYCLHEESWVRFSIQRML